MRIKNSNETSDVFSAIDQSPDWKSTHDHGAVSLILLTMLIAKDQRTSEADTPRLSDAEISTLPYTVTRLFRAKARAIRFWTRFVPGVRRGVATALRTEGETTEGGSLRTEDGGMDRGWKRESDTVGRVGPGRTGRTRQDRSDTTGTGGRDRRCGGRGGRSGHIIRCEAFNISGKFT